MTKAGFTWVTPVLYVRNLVASLDHYEKALGFERVWQWSDDCQFSKSKQPSFACVRRGEYNLFLSEKADLKEPGMVCFNVGSDADLQSVFNEYRSNGVKIVEEPQDRSFGMRDMVIQDPDGNVFRIGLTVEEAKNCTGKC